jgi:hypothetical protein
MHMRFFGIILILAQKKTNGRTFSNSAWSKDLGIPSSQSIIWRRNSSLFELDVSICRREADFADAIGSTAQHWSIVKKS